LFECIADPIKGCNPLFVCKQDRIVARHCPMDFSRMVNSEGEDSDGGSLDDWCSQYRRSDDEYNDEDGCETGVVRKQGTKVQGMMSTVGRLVVQMIWHAAAQASQSWRMNSW
ncbi:hypothetical protein S245_060942, partial [Arachis hypogaea]